MCIWKLYWIIYLERPFFWYFLPRGTTVQSYFTYSSTTLLLVKCRKDIFFSFVFRDCTRISPFLRSAVVRKIVPSPAIEAIPRKRRWQSVSLRWRSVVPLPDDGAKPTRRFQPSFGLEPLRVKYGTNKVSLFSAFLLPVPPGPSFLGSPRMAHLMASAVQASVSHS